MLRTGAREIDPEEPGKPKAGSKREPVELRLIEDRLSDLRSRIGDAAHELDSYRAKTAAALGGGAFLFLLAIGATYDIASKNDGLWFSFGVTRDKLYWLAGALGLASLCLFAIAAMRNRKRDLEGEARLAELEQEFAALLDRRDEISRLNEK
ncbi:MAG TPA: hypothetical protein VNH22_13790 [Blastocatellia bacterium]|jgi:hypothetical protein|nr:hypothetical protein [Blastocatellia bacterium]